jgi:glycosyltransferase involved in cell wall biosynthesis
MKDQKVAIVHDWLIGGGAEKVVEQLHKIYPDAPIYTSYCSPQWRKRLDGKVVTGYLQHLGRIRKFIPFLRIWWFESLKLRDYDLVISSSGAEAKGVKVPRGTPHISYIHAPTHYYWSRYDSYLESPGFGAFDWLARIGLKLLVGPLRKWDYAAAQRPDFLIANSAHTKEQIQKYYHRDSVVIHPPVATDRFQLKAQSSKLKARKSFVITGRHVPYKRVDIAVIACTDLGLDLIVIGDGPEHEKLKAMAGPTIKFLGYSSDKELEDAICSAKAFLFPGIDDFGIVAVEAMSAGTPVIAYKAGGALDYVIPGKTGEFFEEQTAASLAEVLQKFDSSKYSSRDIQKFADTFSNDQFRQKLTAYVKKII